VELSATQNPSFKDVFFHHLETTLLLAHQKISHNGFVFHTLPPEHATSLNQPAVIPPITQLYPFNVCVFLLDFIYQIGKDLGIIMEN